jgi:hypothetical protein
MSADFESEVSSWDLMKEALRLEDRLRMRDLIERASANAAAMKVINEDYQTEAFFLLLLLEQYRMTKELESRIDSLKGKKKKDSIFTKTDT